MANFVDLKYMELGNQGKCGSRSRLWGATMMPFDDFWNVEIRWRIDQGKEQLRRVYNHQTRRK